MPSAGKAVGQWELVEFAGESVQTVWHYSVKVNVSKCPRYLTARNTSENYFCSKCIRIPSNTVLTLEGFLNLTVVESCLRIPYSNENEQTPATCINHQKNLGNNGEQKQKIIKKYFLHDCIYGVQKQTKLSTILFRNVRVCACVRLHRKAKELFLKFQDNSYSGRQNNKTLPWVMQDF